MTQYANLVFVDCEAFGLAPSTGRLTEFGAVMFLPYWQEQRWVEFHGVLLKSRPSAANPAIPEPLPDAEQSPVMGWTYQHERNAVFRSFGIWLKQQFRGRATMVSDNPAFDFMWIADAFALTNMDNPFGHSARRISDFYAGIVGDWRETQRWKRLRITKHDHNPVHDARGNVEAFARLLRGER